MIWPFNRSKEPKETTAQRHARLDKKVELLKQETTKNVKAKVSEWGRLMSVDVRANWYGSDESIYVSSIYVYYRDSENRYFEVRLDSDLNIDKMTEIAPATKVVVQPYRPITP